MSGIIPERELENLKAAGDLIREQYSTLQKDIADGNWSRFQLARMIHQTQLAERVPTFTRHPDAEIIEKRTLEWVEQYGIYLKAFVEGNLTMSAFLHPFRSEFTLSEEVSPFTLDTPESESLKRSILVSKIYALLFYFDDTIGNDRQNTTDSDVTENYQPRWLIAAGLQQIFEASEEELPLLKFPEARSLEAVCDLLMELKEAADPKWLARFLELLKKHLHEALRTHNHERYSLEAFKAARNDVAGMWLTVIFLELLGFYLDWENLDPELVGMLNELKEQVAWIGSLFNDLFSFEKEVIRDKDGFNILPILVLNGLATDLVHAIWVALDMAQQTVIEFEQQCQRIREYLEKVNDMNTEGRRTHPLSPNQWLAVASFVHHAEGAAEASWVWQVLTDRYTQMDGPSIFAETDLELRTLAGLFGKLKPGEKYPSTSSSNE